MPFPFTSLARQRRSLAQTIVALLTLLLIDGGVLLGQLLRQDIQLTPELPWLIAVGLLVVAARGEARSRRRQPLPRALCYLGLILTAVGVGAHHALPHLLPTASAGSLPVSLASQCFSCPAPAESGLYPRGLLYLISLAGLGVLIRPIAMLSCRVGCTTYGVFGILMGLGWLGLSAVLLALVYRWALAGRIRRGFDQSIWFQLTVYAFLAGVIGLFVGRFSLSSF